MGLLESVPRLFRLLRLGLVSHGPICPICGVVVADAVAVADDGVLMVVVAVMAGLVVWVTDEIYGRTLLQQTALMQMLLMLLLLLHHQMMLLLLTAQTHRQLVLLLVVLLLVLLVLLCRRPPLLPHDPSASASASRSAAIAGSTALIRTACARIGRGDRRGQQQCRRHCWRRR